MRDTPMHKHTKPAVPRLVVVLALWLCVAIALPSTAAELYIIDRIGILNEKFFTQPQVGVSYKDQLQFKGLDDLTLRIQISSTCKNDLVDDGMEVEDSQNVNVADIFSKTKATTAFAAFEGIGCVEGSMVKINLLGPVPAPKKPSGGKNPPPKNSGGKNATQSSNNANNATQSSQPEHNNRNATQPKPKQTSGVALSNITKSDVTDDNNATNFTPVAAAIVGSIASFSFAALCAVGFLLYRRRQRHMMGGTTILSDGKPPEKPPPAARRNTAPGPSVRNEPRPAVISNGESPPVYEAAIFTPLVEHNEKTGLVEAEGNETNHEVVTPNCEIVGHMSINNRYTRSSRTKQRPK